MSRIDDLIGGGTQSGSQRYYWQQPVHPNLIKKTAFVIADGRYEWLRSAFGLSNDPLVDQCLMDSLMQLRSQMPAYLPI